MGKFLLLLLSFIFSIASSGQMNTIYYSVDLKTAQEPDSIYSTDSEIITHAFAPLDSLVLDSIAKAYLSVLFADTSGKLFTFWENQKIWPFLPVVEILDPNHHTIEHLRNPSRTQNDTIFISKMPYVASNGDFDIKTGNRSIYADETPTYYNIIRNFSGLFFIENWEFSNGTFQKDIKGTSTFLSYPKKINDSIFRKQNKLSNIIVENSSTNNDTLLVENIIYDVYLLPLHHQWYDDSDDKTNCMNPAQRNKIILDMLEATKEGSIQAFAIEEESVTKRTKPDFTKPLNYDEVIEKLSYTHADTIIHHATLEHVVKFRFYEDWYFSPHTFSFSKQVHGVGFILGAKLPEDICNEYSFIKEKVYFKLD